VRLHQTLHPSPFIITYDLAKLHIILSTLTSKSRNIDHACCTFSFDVPHGLIVGQRLIIKFFNVDVDGAYIVQTVPGVKTLTVNLSLPGDITTITNGDGRAFTLESVACLGCCSLAPVLMIDERTYGKLKSSSLGRIIKDYQEEGQQ